MIPETVNTRIYADVYTNGKKVQRMSVKMSYELALLIAVGDRDAIEVLTDGIARRVEITEGTDA